MEADSYPLMDLGAPEVSLCSDPWAWPAPSSPSPCPAHAPLLQPDRPDPESADYVLVADYRTQRNPRQVHRQRQFLKDLQGKGFQYKVGAREGAAGWHPGAGAHSQGAVPRDTESARATRR